MRKFSQIQFPIWLLKTIAKLCLKQKQKMLNLVTNPVTNSIAISKNYCKTTEKLLTRYITDTGTVIAIVDGSLLAIGKCTNIAIAIAIVTI